MNDLTDLMRESSEQPPGLGLDPLDLVRQGRRRVRRRRAISAGACALALCAVAVTAGTWHFASHPHDQVASDPGDPAAYVEVRLTPRQVLDRCEPILDAQYGRKNWVEVPAHNGTVAGRTVETRVGFTATFVRQGAEATDPGVECSIPQRGLVSTVVAHAGDAAPAARDHAAVAAACTNGSGYDVTGWSEIAAVDDDTTGPNASHDVRAVFRSDNGYIAECDLADRTPLEITRDPATESESAIDGSVLEPEGCSKAGVIPGGEDGWHIQILDGRRIVAAATTTNGGAFSYTLPLEQSRQARPFTGRISDNDGVVVWSGPASAGDAFRDHPAQGCA